jgi:hypothetical protein
MNTSEFNNDSNIFPAFVAMHNAPDIHSDIVRSERELGEWYANYDVQRAWFEGGTLFERNHRGQVSELCKADTEDEAYKIMAARARKDDANVWIDTEANLLDTMFDDQEDPRWIEMVQKLRAVR